MEKYALDGSELPTETPPEGKDMGIAYVMGLKARRFYKKGVKQDELMMLLEMITVHDGTGEIVLRLSSDMKGGVVISDDVNFEQWHISSKEIVDAYVLMRNQMEEEDK